MDNIKILAIDTSTSVASIALSVNNKILASTVISTTKSHSESVMPQVEKLLKDAGCNISDIDIFAVAKGPGSFTGIRIGVMAVKTFAYATNSKIADVCTLDAIARSATGDGLICPLIDARNNQVYTGIYDSNYNRVSEYMGIPVIELADILNKEGKAVTFVGELKEDNRKILEDNLKVDMKVVDEIDCRAESAAYIAYDMYKEGTLKDANEVNPYYLRKSQAERMKK